MIIMNKYYCTKSLIVTNDVIYKKGNEYYGYEKEGGDVYITFRENCGSVGLILSKIKPSTVPSRYFYLFSDYFLTKQQHRKLKIENILK